MRAIFRLIHTAKNQLHSTKPACCTWKLTVYAEASRPLQPNPTNYPKLSTRISLLLLLPPTPQICLCPLGERTSNLVYLVKYLENKEASSPCQADLPTWARCILSCPALANPSWHLISTLFTITTWIGYNPFSIEPPPLLFPTRRTNKQSTKLSFNNLPTNFFGFMERILKEQLLGYLATGNLINKSQHGFLKCRSCTSCHLYFFPMVAAEADGKKQV